MVMEYLEGDSLQRILRRSPAGLPATELSALLDGLLAGVQLVHAAGLMHRDIKPANIIIRPDGRPVLIDFGSTRDAAATGNTITFTQIFSPGYAPIEQVLGRRQGAYSDPLCARCGGLRRHRRQGGGRADPAQCGRRGRRRSAAAGGQGRGGPVSACAAARHRRGLVARSEGPAAIRRGNAGGIGYARRRLPGDDHAADRRPARAAAESARAWRPGSG